MGDFVQENKRYLVALAVGALVWLILYLIIGAIYGNDIKRAKSQIRTAEAQKRKALPPGVSVRRVKENRQESESKFKEMIGRLQHRPASGFALGPEVTQADVHYNRMESQVRETVVEELALRDIDVEHTLGLPQNIPTLARDIDWYLRGLGMVHQLLQQVLATDKKFEGQITRVDKLEIKPPPKRLPGTGAVRPFFNRLEVECFLVGHPQAVSEVLTSLATPRSDGLALLAQAGSRLRSLDSPPGLSAPGSRATRRTEQGLVEARLVVAALQVDEGGKLSAADQENER